MNSEKWCSKRSLRAAAVDNYQMTVATDEKTKISENIEKTSHSQEKKEVTKHDERQEKNRPEDALAGGNPNDEGSSARTSEKDSNRSGVSEEVGETESGLQQDRSSERLHRDEVEFLFDRENDISPEKNSPLYKAQKRSRKNME